MSADDCETEVTEFVGSVGAEAVYHPGDNAADDLALADGADDDHDDRPVRRRRVQ